MEDRKLLSNTYNIQQRWNSKLRIEKGMERIAKSVVATKGCIRYHSEHRPFDPQIDQYVTRPHGSRAANLASNWGFPKPRPENPAIYW